MLRTTRFTAARILAQAPAARTYYLVSHPGGNRIVDPKLPESILFSKALEHVPTHGFTQNAINKAVADLPYLDSIQSIISASSRSSPEFSLTMFWLKSQRQRLLDYVLSDEYAPTSTCQYSKAADLICKRLLYNEQVAPQLSSALKQLVVPYNVPKLIEELGALADDIAFYAGDASNDSAWYAKRFALASIYVKAELYLLQDLSPDMARTRDFVARNVESVKNAGQLYTDTEQWAFFNATLLVNLVKSQLTRG